MLALGVRHAGLNVNLSQVLKPGTPSEFHLPYVEHLDREILELSRHDVLVYVILLVYPTGTSERDAIMLHPESRVDKKFTVGAFNTVTPQGRQFFSAALTMLAQRWGGSDPAKPRVRGWIVGNEVNSHWLWYNRGKKSMGDAVAAYADAFRLAHQSVCAVAPEARLYIPFDHHWATGMSGISPEEATPGRDFLAQFAKIIKEGGDLAWHVAWHPYPEDLGNPRAWADRSVTFDFETPKVTFKNLEVLTRYLAQPHLHWKGQPRRVILSEQGFHSLATPDGPALQAAAYAYAWEKCRHLPTVDAFIYHRHVDHAQEGGLRLGLWTHKPKTVFEPDQKKEIYALFAAAGTPGWDAAAAPYLALTGLKSWDELRPR
jgi:hypothetical protein